MLSSHDIYGYLGIGSVVAALSGLLVGLYYWMLPRPIPGIPYKKSSAWRLLGDAPDVLKWKKETGEMWAYLINLSLELDSPIIQVFMRPLGKPWVVVTDFREAQDIQVNRQHEFDRSKLLEEVFRPFLPGNHSWMPTGDEFRAHRWLIRDTMSPGFLGDVAAPAIRDLTGNLINLWRERARLAQGRPFEAAEDVVKNVVDIILRVTFGLESHAVTSQLDLSKTLKDVDLPHTMDTPVTFPLATDPPRYTLVRTLVRATDIAFASPFPKQALTFALRFYPSLVKAMKWKDEMMTEQIQAALEKFTAPKTLKEEKEEVKAKSAIEAVIKREAQLAERENRPVAYDNTAVRDELFGFFSAGHDTTATTLRWALKRLTEHQQVQQNLRAALRQAYHRAATQNDLPTSDEMFSTEIPYLDAFIQEVHRLGTTVPSVVRMTLRDTPVLGHVVPKGTDVFMMNNGPSFQSPAFKIAESLRTSTSQNLKSPTGVWDDADIADFVPERWLVRGEDGVERFEIRAGPSLPYGFGVRACFGMKFASLELKMIITLLTWSFMFDPIPDDLSGFEAEDINTHTPQKVYLRLRAVQ